MLRIHCVWSFIVAVALVCLPKAKRFFGKLRAENVISGWDSKHNGFEGSEPPADSAKLLGGCRGKENPTKGNPLTQEHHIIK